MSRILACLVLSTGLVAASPAAAQDCFPFDVTTRFAGEVALPSAPACVAASGAVAYVVTVDQVICLDATDPQSPVVIGTVGHALAPRCCTLFGSTLVVGCEAGIALVDVADPVQPALLGSAATPAPVEDVAVCDDLLLVAIGEAGLRFYEVAAGGVPQLAGTYALDYAAIHGAAARGPARILVASEEGLIDLVITDPAAPFVLQVLLPVTMEGNWPHFCDVAVSGNGAVVAMWEDMPVARGGSRDWGDATTLMWLDLAALDPDAVLEGFWVAGWDGDLRLDGIEGDLVLAHDDDALVFLTLTTSLARPSAWAPRVVLDSREPIAGVAFAGGSVVAATADLRLRAMPTGAPVVVEPIAAFAAGEHVSLLDDGWAWSVTPYGVHYDTSYRYTLWDLRDPTAPAAAETVSCVGGFELAHGSEAVASSGDLVVRSDFSSDDIQWSLQDWSGSSATSVPLPTTRSDALFSGDLLLAIGTDWNDAPVTRGLEVVDVADPDVPVARGFLAIAGTQRPARPALGNRLVVGTHQTSGDTLLMVDFSDPDQPQRTDALRLTANVYRLETAGDLVLGTDGQGRLWVFGRDPLRLLSELDGPAAYVDVAVAGSMAWLLWGGELVAVDLADPTQPVRRGACVLPDGATALAVRHATAYVACGMYGLHAYRIEDPDAPVWVGGGGAAADGLCNRGACLLVPGAVMPLDCGELVAAPERPAAAPVCASLTAAPNPFNPRTVISFDVPRAGEAAVAVFDLRGRRVMDLWRGACASGRHDVTWDGLDDGDRDLPSGVYLVRLQTGGEVVARKLTLAR